MKAYEDPNDPLNGSEHHTGRKCIIEECSRPAGTAWSPWWCQPCNAGRMNHISVSLSKMLETFNPDEPLPYPDRSGVWKNSEGDSVDVYPLYPVGGTLCIWGPDIGITFTGTADTQGVWLDDEWQGHIPVSYGAITRMGPWTYVSSFNEGNSE